MREPIYNWQIKQGQFWGFMDFQQEWLDAIYKISKQSTKLDDRDVLNLIELICEIHRGEIPLELNNRLNKDIISEITDLELLLKLKNHVSKQVQAKAELRLKEKNAESKQKVVEAEKIRLSKISKTVLPNNALPNSYFIKTNAMLKKHKGKQRNQRVQKQLHYKLQKL